MNGAPKFDFDSNIQMPGLIPSRQDSLFPVRAQSAARLRRPLDPRSSGAGLQPTPAVFSFGTLAPQGRLHGWQAWFTPQAGASATL